MLARKTARTFSVDDFAVGRFNKFAGPGVRFLPLSIADNHLFNANTYIEIDHVDRTAFVEPMTLEINNILTRQVDTASFSFKYKYGSSFDVAVNSNVRVYDAGYLIFQGIVTNVRKTHMSGRLVLAQISCVDYTRELDSKVVAQTYENVVAQDIVKDIILRYAPQFDTRYVYAPHIINKIQFTYEPVSKCLEQLADILGYDFWVDENKYLHFIQVNTTGAPFTLRDDNGSYVRGTLMFEDDINQLRNSVFLRGGNEIGASTSFQEVADGNKATFPLGYHFSVKPTVTVNAVSQTVGTNNQDNAASYNCMWDPTGDFVVFATPPTAGQAVVVTGTPLYPILMRLPERSSVALYGERQIVIIDKTITSRSGARQRALAELLRYANALVSATFTTYTRGLQAGQLMSVNSTLFGKSGDYIVTQVRTRPWTHTRMQYEVTLVSTKLMDIVDLLGKMLREKLKEQDYSANESFDPAEVVFEDMSFDEVISTRLGGTVTVNETMTNGESVTVQALNFGWTAVWGIWTPDSSNKRGLNWDRSTWV